MIGLAVLFTTERQLGAQCQGGRSMSSSMQQGRLQTRMQQSLLQSATNQQQQNAFSTALQQQQQNGLTAVMQQQQQIAMLAALQQLQQNRQLMAVQQQQNALLVNQPQQQNLVGEATPRRRQRRSFSAEYSDIDAPLPQRYSSETESDDDVAARRFKMAKDLATDADRAEFQGDRQRAATLRQRAGERLHGIVESFPTTSSADQAKVLIQTLNR